PVRHDDLLPHLPRLPTRRQPPNEGAGPSPRRSRRRRAQHVAGRSLTTAPLRAPWLSGGTAGADRVGGMNKRALLAGGLAASAATPFRSCRPVPHPSGSSTSPTCTWLPGRSIAPPGSRL